MAFAAFLIIYCLRVDISVAIVAMINSTALSSEHNSTSSAFCGESSHSSKVVSFISARIFGIISSCLYFK